MDTTQHAAAPGPARWAVALALATVYLVWGSTYLGIRFALEGGFPPFLLGGLRFVLAGALLFAFLRLRGTPAPTPGQWRNAAVLGLLLVLLGNGLVNVAEQTVSSGMAAVAVAAEPIWIGLFAALRGERPSRIEWLGLAVGFGGVLWLNASSSLAGSPAGLLCLLAASIAWSFGSIWSRGRDLAAPFMNAAAQMVCGGAAMLLVGVFAGERMHGVPTPGGLAAFAYLVVFGSWGAYSAYVWLLRHVRPALAGSFAYVSPAIAVLLGALLGGERFAAGELGAMGVILLGVVAISVAKAARAQR